MRYSPPGLHAILFTGPACPVIAPTSVQISSPVVVPPVCVHRHRRHPPDHPHASASEPPDIHMPPTNPPRRCPPTSPKRCWMVQSEDGLLFLPDGIDTGDQRIREESVDVDSNVSFESSVFEMRQASDVTPASCPTSNASNVIENCCVLEGPERPCTAQSLNTLTSLPRSSLSAHVFLERFVARLLRHHRPHQAMLQKHPVVRRSTSLTRCPWVMVG